MSRKNRLTGAGFGIVILSASLIAAGCNTSGEGFGANGATGDTASSGSPRIAGAYPDSSGTEGGQSVTLFAYGFEDDFTLDLPLVYFGSEAAVVFAVERNIVRAITPPGGAAPVDLTLEATGIYQTATLSDGFRYVDAPRVVTVIPNRGDATGGDMIMITTSNFRDDFTQRLPLVFFGTLPAPVVPVDATTVWAETPRCPVGPAVVTVESAGAAESAALEDGFTYTYQGDPQILSISPTGGEYGTIVTLTTDGFLDDFTVYLPRVFFGSTEITVTTLDAATIRVVIPSLPYGIMDVIVESSSGQTAILVDGWFFC